MCRSWAEREASPWRASPWRRLFRSLQIMRMAACKAYLTHPFDLKSSCMTEIDWTISFQNVVWFPWSIPSVRLRQAHEVYSQEKNRWFQDSAELLQSTQWVGASQGFLLALLISFVNVSGWHKPIDFFESFWLVLWHLDCQLHNQRTKKTQEMDLMFMFDTMIHM